MAASTMDRYEAELLARLHRNERRESLIDALRSHDFPLSAAELLLIRGTDDDDVLRRWIDRAAMATSLDEVFLPAEVAAARRDRPAHAPHASLCHRSRALHSIIDACLGHAYSCGCLGARRRGGRKGSTGVYVFRRPRIPDYEIFEDVEGVELLFELVGAAQARSIDALARDRIARGLRRVIGIFVREGEVREWSPASEEWLVLDPAAVLTDPVLAIPIPVATLLDPTKAEVEGSWRLGTQRWLAIQEEDEAEEAAKRAEHRRWCRKWLDACIAVVDELCAHHGIVMSSKERKRMKKLDVDDLIRLFDDILGTNQIPAWLGRRASGS